MNTIESFQGSINSFINELCSNSDFSHLKINISAYISTTRKSVVSIESNANIGIKNSLVADSMIDNYINGLFKEYHGEEKYLFKIVYTDLKDKENRVSNTPQSNNPDVEVIENFSVEKPKYRLSSVILPKDKWDEVHRALSMIKNYDKVYKEWGFDEIDPSSKTIICFYGKPGTGKTKCAHGIAEYLNKMILCASYADIQSQYVGVGPKNLRNIFKQAEEEDAVLFFDEADAFLRKRTSDTSSSAAMHYNSMTNEMMKHLEDFNGLVIFATNLTENIDEAFMTRITASIEFPIPDLETRVALIKELIPKKVPINGSLCEEDYYRIANVCDGFVGRDIRNAIKTTLSDAAERGLDCLSSKEFEDGFEKYKTSKDNLNDDINGKTNKDSIYEQIEWNTANSAVLAICSYAAWFDGPETENETKKLKLIANQLNRDKVIITKLSDLPSLEELTERVKIPKQKMDTMDKVASILAISGDDDINKNLLNQLCDLFVVEEENRFKIIELYQLHKSLISINENLLETVIKK